MQVSPETKSRRRSAVVAVLLLIVFVLYGLRLFQIQIVEGAAYAAHSASNTKTNITIPATRGEILDRTMQPMVVNQTSYAVIIDYNYFPRGSSEEAHSRQNAVLWQLTQLLSQAGESWNDTLPISMTAPYTFDSERESAVASLKEDLRLADYATADNCMAALVEEYDLSHYSADQQRVLAGIQYEMEQSGFSASTPYEFASGVSKETSYQISENSQSFPGVDIQLQPVRDYVAHTVAAHLLGTVGPLYPEEYEQLQDKGYAYNDRIGKSGIELAMEEYLRGSAGVRTLVKDSGGTVVEEYESVTPVPGDSIILTLDMSLQAQVEQILDAEIQKMRAKAPGSDGQDIQSGSVVMMDLKGGVLVCASWPTYDLATYYTEYTKLEADPDVPLFNRALYGEFEPGSTFKPAVAIGVLTEGLIDGNYTYYCGHAYTHYAAQGLTVRCTGSHGNANVVWALGKSCNSFFCEMGRLLTINKMNEYCRRLGLGVETGIEIGEAPGLLAGVEEREASGGIWNPGDTVIAAIGQSDNAITPIQLCAYAVTLANRGTRYKAHLVKSIRSYDGQTETVIQPEILEQMDDVSDETWDLIHQGMLLTATNGTATRFFRGVDYDFAAKTGTAEAGNNGSDHGVFIGYAPAENPEVVISVVMENGTATASGEVARSVLDAYFASRGEGTAQTPEGELLD